MFHRAVHLILILDLYCLALDLLTALPGLDLFLLFLLSLLFLRLLLYCYPRSLTPLSLFLFPSHPSLFLSFFNTFTSHFLIPSLMSSLPPIHALVLVIPLVLLSHVNPYPSFIVSHSSYTRVLTPFPLLLPSPDALSPALPPSLSSFLYLPPPLAPPPMHHTTGSTLSRPEMSVLSQAHA